MTFARSGCVALCAALVAFTVTADSSLAAAGPCFVGADEIAGLPPTTALSVRFVNLSSPERPDPSRDHEEAVFEFGTESGVGSAGDEPQAFFLPVDASVRHNVEPFLATGDLPPVVRAQSPPLELLPLATGDVPIEQTSLLSSVTGTSGRLGVDYLTDFGGTTRIRGQALTKTWMGIGIDTEADYWQRQVPNRGSEPLWTGDLNVIYSLMPHPRFKLRSGAGAAWRIEDGNPHAGYNLTTGLDVYLLWRFMLTGEVDYGAIRHDKLFRYRVGLGLTWKTLEFFSGYDSYKLGNEHLDGWMNGVQFWY
jgi:hypothetical protein